MFKNSKSPIIASMILLAVLVISISFFVLAGNGDGERESNKIDIGFFNYSYGYNATSNIFTNWDSLSYKVKTNGIIEVRKDRGTLSYFSFALTGTVDGEDYLYTAEDFNWDWSVSNQSENWTFVAYNNNLNFNWTQTYNFYPDKSMKIKHVLTNDLANIENTKMWYIHTIEQGEIIIFNNTEYKLNLTNDKHFQGNFNNILPKIDIKSKYFFDYSDLVENNFDITDVYLGNGSIVGHSEVYIMAVGFTKNNGYFPKGAVVKIDPTIETVDSTNDVGQGSSIAIDSNDIVHITHYDYTNGDLRYCNNTGDTWNCTAVDTGSIGWYSTIAIDSNDIVHVSYNNGTGYDDMDLRYCNSTGGTWNCTIVDTNYSGYSGGVDSVGWYSSMAIDSNDIVHISHQGYVPEGWDDLRYCNNTGGTWNCTVIEDGTGTEGGVGWVGYYTSIAVDSTDLIHITHFDDLNDDLRYCNNTGGTWNCTVIDGDKLTGLAVRVGYYSSIAIDSNDIVHVSYLDYNNEDLKYCNNTGGSWDCTAVDTTGGVGWFSSMAIDANDFVHILHFKEYLVSIRYCNNVLGSWSCKKLINTDMEWPLDYPGARELAIKKGRLSHFPGNFSNYSHISWYNNTNLMYTLFYLGPPNVTSLTEYPTDPESYQYTQTYVFNATVVDDFPGIDTVLLEFGGTNYTATNLTADVYSVSFASLSANPGGHSYRWYANDTSGVANNTETGTYTITQANPSGNMNIAGTSPIVYPITSDFSGSETNNGDGGCSYSMDRNNKVYGVGMWTFTYSTTGCANYTSGNTQRDLTVSQNTTYVLGISGTTPITYGTTTNVAGSDCPSELTCSLDKSNKVYGVGTETFNYSTPGNTNYSANSITKGIVINKATPSASITNNKAWTRTYDGTSNTLGISESNTGDADVVYNLSVDGADEGSSYVQGTAGTYEVVLNTTGGANYSSSASLDSNTLTINKATPTGSLTSDLGWTINESQEVVIGLSESNTGDSDVDYNVSRDGVDKGTGETWTPALGTYDYVLNTTGGANYSTVASMDTETLTVNDVTEPIPSIVYPTNTSFSTNVSELNYTYTETNPSRCWYSTDGGSTNSSDVACGTNFTTITSTEGSNTWILYMNDTSGNENSTSVSFFKDTIAPQVSIVYPTNTTYATNESELNYTYTETNPSRCWYSNDSGTTNSSDVSCGVNFTNVLSKEGSNTWTLYMNDTLGNENLTSVTFFKDSIYPQISMSSPTNNTNTTNTGLNITYIYTEVNCDTVWWNDDNGANTTLASCGTNITSPTWAEGKHNITIFMNDTANNLNSTAVSFLIDTTYPTITIDHPEARTYSINTTLSLNYTVSDAGSGVDSCWYNVYNETKDEVIANTTIASCANTTFSLPGGDIDYNLTLYSNDSVNNINSGVVEFGIRLDVPSVVLDVPSNNSYLSNGTNVYFNFTATDINGLDTCRLWHNNTGTWHKNYTWIGPNSSVMNYTTANLSENTFIWNVWCNDTTSKSDWALNNFTLTVDETNPNVTITTTNNTEVENTLSITINYNISDTNIDTCYFTLRTSEGAIHNYPENTSLSCSLTSRSISTLYYGTFIMQIWGEDKAGNLNDANITFITISSGGGGGGGGEAIIGEEEPEVPKTFCGNGICESWGNDLGIKEDWFNCNQDCEPFDFDAFVYSFTKYCWDKDPSTICFFQMLFVTVPMEEDMIVKNDTIYKNGQVCYLGVCESINVDTLVMNCFKEGLPCFWKSNASFIFLFAGGTVALGLSFIKIRAPGKREKVSPYKYIKLRVKKGRRKWRR